MNTAKDKVTMSTPPFAYMVTASCTQSLICCFNLMLIPLVISDQVRYLEALSTIPSGRGLQVGQRPLNCAYAKQKQSVSKPMLDFTGVHAD